MSRRQRLRGVIALVAYLAAALLAPALHRAHHARHGDDHVHSALGTIYLHSHAGESLGVLAHHGAFDELLADLDLADVAHAGVADVDCDYAAYTLTCDDLAARAHAHSFGDELLAHAARTPAPPPDLEHGKGSFEHLAASLLTARAFVFLPPQRTVQPTPHRAHTHQCARRALIRPAPRGPPDAERLAS